MQLDMFGATEVTATRDSAPPVKIVDSWIPPEAVAFNNALKRGSLGNAVGILNRLKTKVVWQVLLASGFSVGAADNRASLIASVQSDIIAASRERMTGFELKQSRENPPVSVSVPDRELVTSDVAAKMAHGMRVVDGAGKEYEAFSARHQYLEAHPLDNKGKPIIFAGSSVIFHLDPATAGAYPERRHDAIFFDDAIQVANTIENADDTLSNNGNNSFYEEKRGYDGSVGQQNGIFVRDGRQDLPNGRDGRVDFEPLDDGMAVADNNITVLGELLGNTGNTGGTGDGSAGERAELSTPDTARNHEDVRNQSGSTNGVEPDNEKVKDPASPDGLDGADKVNTLNASEITDYVLTDEDRIGLGGLAEKFQDNLKAIQVLKVLDSEKRNAVDDEKRLLARYVGWGGLKGVFDPDNKQWGRQHAALKSVLTEEEWAAARRSQLDAFYTPPVVAKSMFAAGARLGFNRGRILDPSVGVGNFYGFMPPEMRGSSQLHGCELDILTSQIVAALYPSAKIAKSTGFQAYNVPAGYFDMVIGNPPFGSQTISDEKGSAYSGWSIHNYFFAKSIEMLRPGGIMPMVVSHSFLDKLDPHVRRWIARRAELVSGARLPNTAFKENANTEVVTDVLIFRRVDIDNELGDKESPDWLNTTDVVIVNPKTGVTENIAINSYFVNNPQNVLGVNSTESSQFRANEYTVIPNGDLETQLAEWVGRLPHNIYTSLDRSAAELEEGAIDVPEHIKEGSFYLQSEVIWQRLPDAFGEQRAQKWEAPNARAFDRMAGMIRIRDKLRAQMRLERSLANDATIKAGRRELNRVYDGFQRQYGYLNDPLNRRLFIDDTESSLIQALEFDYEKAITPSKAEEYGIEPRSSRCNKADIFTQRVLFPPTDIEIVETAKDALLHSLNITGRVDMEYMCQAYGKNEEVIVAELGDLLFVDPVHGRVAMDEYLSGDVKTKLAEAIKASERDPSFEKNVEALQKIIPADKLPSEIHASIGAAWIPADVFKAFAKEISGADVSFNYVIATGQWLHRAQTTPDYTKDKNEYGTDKMGGLSILAHIMNSRGLEIKKLVEIDGKDKYVTDEEATEAVRQKGDKVRSHWDSWLWQNGERADVLAHIYNDRFNRTVERKYDGSHLTLPGISPAISLLSHQKNGVWRALQDRKILLDQVVGAGKTFEIVGIAMEMRRLGISKKPMIAVPNHLTLQWRSEFYRLYPGANVLAATPQDFDKEHRERLFSKIVTGNWDAVIVGHSSLKKIAVPLEAETKIVKEQFDDIAEAIETMKRERGDRNVIRDMEKIKDNLASKLVNLRAKGGKKDNVVDFADLGVDALFVDEMHEFKNLFFTTQMNRVSGLGNPAGSGKAFDLFVKIRYLEDTFGEKSPLVTATGTPVSNSLAEMFTMQRYMQYGWLKSHGLHVFDAWAKQYGDVQNVYEVAPSGTGYRLSQRFAKFKNLPSLMGAYRGFADVVTQDDLKAQETALGKIFPVPKIEGGRPANIVAQRSQLQEKFFGIPEIVRDDAGNIKFEINLDKQTAIIQREADKKWVMEQVETNGYATTSKGYSTAEEAAYMTALGAITPLMSVDPNSIVGQFENLRELTRQTKGKINALSLTGLANKAGLDYRLIDVNAIDYPDSKVNQAIRSIIEIGKEWESEKGVQLVFCDLSVPLSAKAKMANKEKRVYVRDEQGSVTHKKGTLHTVKDYEGLPYILVAANKGKEKSFSMYDPVSGQLMRSGFDNKQDAHQFVSKFVSSENGQERWLDMRENAAAITLEEIDEYKNEHQIDVDGDAADLEITAQDIEGATGVAGFSIYDDMKAKMVASGIPANQIEFIHDHDTPQAKDMLFKRVNAGDVRYLFGSTPKMGAGTNVQRRLVALHHVDAPWRPSDLEQREGRIIRRGNLFYERDPESFTIRINRYATAMTYDTRRWQLLEHKASGIEQLRKYDGANEIEDVTTEASNSADMKAAASGNPLILKETQLATEVKKLRALERAHHDGEFVIRNRMNNHLYYAKQSGPNMIGELKTLQAQRDQSQVLAIYEGKQLFDKEEVMAFVEKIDEEIKKIKLNNKGVDEVKKGLMYRGLKFEFVGGYFDQIKINYPDGERGYVEKLSPSGTITRLENCCNGIEDSIAGLEARIKNNLADAEKMAALLGKPFDQGDVLTNAINEHGKVQRALMKSNSMAAVRPEHMAAFKNAVEGQKHLLRTLGLGDAVVAIEAEDVLDVKILESAVKEPSSDKLKAPASPDGLDSEMSGDDVQNGRVFTNSLTAGVRNGMDSPTRINGERIEVLVRIEKGAAGQAAPGVDAAIASLSDNLSGVDGSSATSVDVVEVMPSICGIYGEGLDIDHLKTRLVEVMPVEVEEGWLVMNAPRPLLGTQTMTGDFVTGRFYAAIAPDDLLADKYVEENRKLDARLLVAVSRDTQMEIAMADCQYRDQYMELDAERRWESLSGQLYALRDKPYGAMKSLISEVSANINNEAGTANDVVSTGRHSGTILHITGKVAVQKTGRNPDDVVRHDVKNLCGEVFAGASYDIVYQNRVGVIGGTNKVVEAGR